MENKIEIPNDEQVLYNARVSRVKLILFAAIVFCASIYIFYLIFIDDSTDVRSLAIKKVSFYLVIMGALFLYLAIMKLRCWNDYLLITNRGIYYNLYRTKKTLSWSSIKCCRMRKRIERNGILKELVIKPKHKKEVCIDISGLKCNLEEISSTINNAYINYYNEKKILVENKSLIDYEATKQMWNKDITVVIVLSTSIIALIFIAAIISTL